MTLKTEQVNKKLRTYSKHTASTEYSVKLFSMEFIEAKRAVNKAKAIRSWWPFSLYIVQEVEKLPTIVFIS